MADVRADTWVLTETRASVFPDDAYRGLHAPHPTRRDDADERSVSVWSHWPLRPTGLPPDPRGAASVLVDHPSGRLVVFGTVLPWANDRTADGGAAAAAQNHYDTIETQGEQWR